MKTTAYRFAIALAIFALAVFLRWPAPSSALGGDEGDYDQLARRILSGEGMTSPEDEAWEIITPLQVSHTRRR